MRFVLERKTEEYTTKRRGEERSKAWQDGAGKRASAGGEKRERRGLERSLNLLVVGDDEKEVGEERWSRQLRHYIPNRKRDKANKTLSGRRSANRTPC